MIRHWLDNLRDHYYSERPLLKNGSKIRRNYYDTHHYYPGESLNSPCYNPKAVVPAAVALTMEGFAVDSQFDFRRLDLWIQGRLELPEHLALLELNPAAQGCFRVFD